jgi:hypothetical protein
MIVNDVDVESIAIGEFEAQTPTPIDHHRPLIPATSLEFVKPEALQIAKFGQIRRGIEHRE